MPTNNVLTVEVQVRWRRTWLTSLVLWLCAWPLAPVLAYGGVSPCRLGRWAIGLTRLEMRVLPGSRWTRLVPEFTCDDDDDGGVFVAYPELDRALGAI